MLPLLQPARPKFPPSRHNVPASPSPAYDCAVRHPVFFTCALRKPPFALPHDETMNPVARGYISENQNQKKQTKL
ncbi:hypothetical protein HDK77DRAFT_485600 [Phyllosticta capitalensis]|uniref:Uncharacterized protein n=1 Tax=Phyllosticta capitalensis TaxID=121624 RepID=A0ABR1YRB7_9PEZI